MGFYNSKQFYGFSFPLSTNTSCADPYVLVYRKEKYSNLPSFKRLDVVRSRDTVNSAVALVKTSGVKPTGMLRLLHSFMSTCS